MIEVRETVVFSEWLGSLRDAHARARIQARMIRLRLGNFGDFKQLGEGVAELRINYGPGYRVYFVRQGDKVVVLLGGGDKRTQERDIKAAISLARTL